MLPLQLAASPYKCSIVLGRRKKQFSTLKFIEEEEMGLFRARIGEVSPARVTPGPIPNVMSMFILKLCSCGVASFLQTLRTGSLRLD